ncbi:MAG: MBL fold metallo-hydrolase [Candidatus Omnitrophota bacterium]
MSKITIHILGTTAGVPTRKRAHPAVYLSYDDGEEFCCLFDCGEGTQRQLMVAGLKIMKIDNVFITHWHGDHCLGIPGMVDTMGFEGREKPLRVYAPEARKLRKCLGFTYSMGAFRVAARNVPAKGSRATDLLETDRFCITSIPVKHSVPAVAYALMEKDKTCIDPAKAKEFGLPEKGKFYEELKKKGEAFFENRRITLEDISIVRKGKKIVYSGDTEICDNLRKMIRGADLLIQDCTYFEEMGSERPHKHASLPEVIEMVSGAGVKQTILTHISRKYQDTAGLKALVEGRPEFTVAEDFLKVVV